MNNQRRKELKNVITEIEGILADNEIGYCGDADFDSIVSSLEKLRDEEEECFENLPEGIQDSERGEMMQEAIENLEEAVSLVESAQSEAEDDEYIDIDEEEYKSQDIKNYLASAIECIEKACN